jgi:caa(3)-type oxidase subunit IV
MSTETPVMNETSHENEYPGEGIYFAIFILLAALTVGELVATYLPIVQLPLLLGLAIAKAWLVVQFYMHLRYDKRILSWTFLIPVIVGIIATLVIQPLVSSAQY